MRTRTRDTPWRIRRPPGRCLTPAGATLLLAIVTGLALCAIATQAAEERGIEDVNGNRLRDEYETVPYTGFKVSRGSPPAGVVLSVHPLPVLPGRVVNVAVLHDGPGRIRRVRVDPDVGVPLMVDHPAAADGLTLVPFYLAKETGGDSLQVTVFLDEAVLTRRVPIAIVPEFGDFVHVEKLPEAVSRTSPAYPDEARRARVDGIVMVQALVGTDGRVWDTRITKSVHGLDEAAAASVRQWRFNPGLAGGKPVAIWVAVPVRFSLH